jgi:hypothetical protein
MINNKNQLFLVTVVASTVPLFFAAPSIAAAQSSTTANLLSQQISKLIQQLEAAKQADWNAALDPSVSPVRRGTFLNQMNKADRASKELRHGFSIPQSEIKDALWSPPKHISPEERAQLIRELEQAKQQDERNEQQMFNDAAWSHSAAPMDTVTFEQRKEEVDRVVENLEIGAPVHWTAIKQALVVPISPY